MTCEKKILIAGPCSSRGRAQIREETVMVTSVVRSILNPNAVDLYTRQLRTKQFTLACDKQQPGTDAWIWGFEVCKEKGVGPASEIVSTEEAELFRLLSKSLGIDKAVAWFGSRKFDGEEIKESTEILMDHPGILIGIKNPPNDTVRDWEGRITWVLKSGIDPKRVFIIERGHPPEGKINPDGLRNIPDHQMALGLGSRFGIRAIFDPSHSGGRPELVKLVLRTAPNSQYDGHMIEASDTETPTDNMQRLNMQDFIEAIKIIAPSINNETFKSS